MTKIEKKLINLGYHFVEKIDRYGVLISLYRRRIKANDELFTIDMYITPKKVDFYRLLDNDFAYDGWYKQEQINTLQKALNIMKKDLEELNND